jgi:hypothetical protein
MTQAMDQLVEANDEQGLADSGRLPYHPPLLRSHGDLRDVTAQKSADVPSDVNSKDNLVPISWA